MKQYIGPKKVSAEKAWQVTEADGRQWIHVVGKDCQAGPGSILAAGYRIVHEDGKEEWMPQHLFEMIFRAVEE